MSTPPSGWYPDPAADAANPGRMRWWDGAWSEHVRDPEVAVASPADTVHEDVLVGAASTGSSVVGAAVVGAPAVSALAVEAPLLGSLPPVRLVPPQPTAAASSPATHAPVIAAATASRQPATAMPGTQPWNYASGGAAGTGERNPFSRASLTLGIATVASAILLGIIGGGFGIFSLLAAVLAVLFGILGMVRSKRTGTGKAASIWGTVLGPVGLVAALVVMVVLIVLSDPMFLQGFRDGVEGAQPRSPIEQQLLVELNARLADSGSTVMAVEMRCPADAGSDAAQFVCTAVGEDGSSAPVTASLSEGTLSWQMQVDPS
ncbi:MAG: DUF2510 domain-containing protein [Leifsonia sp.]